MIYYIEGHINENSGYRINGKFYHCQYPISDNLTFSHNEYCERCGDSDIVYKVQEYREEVLEHIRITEEKLFYNCIDHLNSKYEELLGKVHKFQNSVSDNEPTKEEFKLYKIVKDTINNIKFLVDKE